MPNHALHRAALAAALLLAVLLTVTGCRSGREEPVEYRVSGATGCGKEVLTVYAVNGETEDAFVALPFTHAFLADPGDYVSLYAFNPCRGGGVTGLHIAIRHGGRLLETASVVEVLPPDRYGRAGIGVGMFLPPLPTPGG